MESTGKLISANRNLTSNKLQLTFEIDSMNSDEVNLLAGCEKLNIKANKFREKRSLDANGLLWACIGQIAAALNTDKWEVYLTALKTYGKYTYICVKPAVVDAVKAQWRECEEIGKVNINGQEAVQLLCYFGSSTYDTKEFSVLLEGIISEMQEMGLERPTSKDMERALQAWENSHK